MTMFYSGDLGEVVKSLKMDMKFVGSLVVYLKKLGIVILVGFA